MNDFRGHTPRNGDADCDGDLDIAGGPWEIAAGTPIFDADRLPYELGALEKPHCRK